LKREKKSKGEEEKCQISSLEPIRRINKKKFVDHVKKSKLGEKSNENKSNENLGSKEKPKTPL
jgi:hypothetical protein